MRVADAADGRGPVSREELAIVFPSADGVGRFDGTPPAAPVYRGSDIAGFVFSTEATVGSVGYSGKPIDILVGVNTDGVITGALLRRHSEPILVIGISQAMLVGYVSGFSGTDLRTNVREDDGSKLPDAIAGATVSSAAIRDGIIRAGRSVARSRGLLGTPLSGERLDRESFAPADWRSLIADGSVVERRISQGEVAESFRGTEARFSPEKPADVFIDLYAALVTPPRIGQNLVGKAAFSRLLAEMGVDDQAILVAANGLYSFKGTGYVRTGRFDRIQVLQGDATIALTKDNYRNVENLNAAGAPEFREVALFIIRGETGFDPLKPWRLDLAVNRPNSTDGQSETTLSMEYQIPESYRLNPSGAETMSDASSAQPMWQSYWQERWARIAVAIAVLVILSAVLVFQDTLVGYPDVYWWTRHGLLVFTLFWMGGYAGAQLSVVNVLTFIHSLLTEFRWEFFLLDPLIFILWGYVAVTLLFWGRGVFCGWLCPFGALQELLNEGARKLKVPQITVPFLLHERLWPIKYMIFLGLFALSLHSVDRAFWYAEVEPFKTVISLKFMREWPFVFYAIALLVVGLFIERFFCRYLCPLGAALAIPARLRMFEWLKRRPQCGRECGVCAQHCPVQAIHPIGSINPNECIHCLQCQNLFYDEWVCPPLAQRRKRRERRTELASRSDAEPLTD